MSYQLKQASTAQPLEFLMIDTADHLSGKAGLTVTVTIRKAGGSFITPTGSVTEIANGWYQVAGNATDTATLGPLALHATSTGADPTDMLYQVVAFDPLSANLGLFAQLIETGLSLQQALALLSSVLTGISTGGGSGTDTFNSADVSAGAIQGTNARINGATVDNNGNRSVIPVSFTGLP